MGFLSSLLPQTWIIKFAAVVLVVVALTGAYFYEANRIRTAAIQEFVATQLQQIVADKDEQISQLQVQIRTLANAQRELDARQASNRERTRAATSRVQQNSSPNGIASERVQIALDSIRSGRTPTP